MADPTYKQLQEAAKRAGVNPFGVKKSELIAQVGHLIDEPVTTPENTPPHVSRETSAPREERTETREPAGRQARIPLGVARQKLAYSRREGYVRRWFNDNRNRLSAAEAAGYTFVTEERDGRDAKVSQVVGVKEDGSPMAAYLMEIRQEFYNEDQAAKERINAQVDEQLLRRTEPEGTSPADQGRFYQPTDGRSMRTEVG
jgi:hypothetical protein